MPKHGMILKLAKRLKLALTNSLISSDDVQWIVNNIGELGVKIGSRAFFMYKGGSLEYYSEDSAMSFRPIYKREFGEVIKTNVVGGDFQPLPTISEKKGS